MYLNPLDHFIKRTLKCRYYLRYVDDMILLAPEREMLDTWRHAIETFLRERLQLALRPEMTEPFTVRRGIDFVGWKTWWNRRLPRRRMLGDLQTRLHTFERLAVRTVWGGRAQHIPLQSPAAVVRVDALHAVLASYSGHLRHGATHQFWSRLWARYPWLEALYARQGWQLTPRWSWRPLMRRSRLQAAYGHFLRQAGNHCLVFFPCGRFIEFYGPQRRRAAATLGLRTVPLPRAHFALTAGFPWWLFGVYLSRAVRHGLCVVQVRQYPSPLSPHAMIRLPYGIWLPMPDRNPWLGCNTST